MQHYRILGNKPSMETPKPDAQPADTQEQASGAVPEQVDETPQVVRRISGKQRRASLRNTRRNFSTFRPSKTVSPYSSAAARAMPLTASSACSANGG